MRNKQRGATMIEVLVSLVVLSIGLLGVASTQLMTMKNGNNAEYRYRASVIVYDMMERMRSNLVGVENGNYDAITVKGTENKVSCEAECTSEALAKFDSYLWGQKVSTFPGGVGSVTRNGDTYIISMAWQEQNTNGSEATDSSSRKNGNINNNEFKLEIRL